MINKELQGTIEYIDSIVHDNMRDFIHDINMIMDKGLMDEDMNKEQFIHDLNVLVLKKEGISIKNNFKIINARNDYDSRVVIEECDRLYGIDEDTVNKVSIEINHQLKRGVSY